MYKRQAPQAAAAADASRCGDVAQAPFEPDAALVNYYRAGDTLTGHRDDVERDLSQPIVSVSLGAPAVLLLGGATVEHPPVALWLRSGDVVVMAAAARLCYHGAPPVSPASVLCGPQLCLPDRCLPAHDGLCYHEGADASCCAPCRFRVSLLPRWDWIVGICCQGIELVLQRSAALLCRVCWHSIGCDHDRCHELGSRVRRVWPNMQM